MTTAQSPVDVLRAALERIRDAASDGASNAYNLGNIARTALAQAAALAAEVPGRLSTDSTSVGNCISAAPPPAPVPGGMRESIPAVRMCMVCQSRQKVDPTARWADNDHPPGACFKCGRETGMLVVAAALAAATPPEVVAGMPDPRCKECGHTKLEHEVAEPHRCVVCLCAAFDDVKMGGKLLASHPLVKPPSTPPVQQQGETRCPHGNIGYCTEACMWSSVRNYPQATPEAPTPPPGKCETCGGRGWTRGASYMLTCPDCNGTGSRPPTDSQGKAKP